MNKENEPKTTRGGLQAPENAPLILRSAEEPLNSTSLQNGSNVNSPVDGSKSVSHWGSGYNSQAGASISGHNVFVLGIDGKPLTPTTNAKARRLMEGNQAKPIWNKFGLFGIQMLVEVGNKTPTTVLGIDFGTKFEGYSVIVGTENNLSVMWKLPDKKQLVRKLKERSQLRITRRRRTCRRRAQKHNSIKKGFIAPSQLMVVQSRLKAMQEFFKCYPITDVALEDVRFNHRDKRWGKNFSTIELGKTKIYNWIKQNAKLHLYLGQQTPKIREHYNYGKSSRKNAETFNAHCSDALALALDIHRQNRIDPGPFIVVDDTYRSVRRQLHDLQFSKGGVRNPYSSGNFKRIRKGSMCKHGQLCGGNNIRNASFVRNWENERLSRAISKIAWFSHNFKTNIHFDREVPQCNQ